MKKEKRWWHLNLFGLEIKPIYGVVAGLILWFAFDRSSILSIFGTLLFIGAIVAFIADLFSKKKKK